MSTPCTITVRVQERPFDIGSEIALARKALGDQASAAGAMVTFTGTVRDLTAGLETLTLEHYPGMTEREITQVAKEARERWSLFGIFVIHRIGPMMVGDDIVLVVTHSVHRHAAFDAAEFLMDHLKTRAPFWKKEAHRDGTSDWVDARESDANARDRWEK